jgi:ribosome-associated protein
MNQFAIHTEYIQLNQLLKLVAWAETGAEANEMITAGLVKVNGNVELRKRNKIYPGMKVEFESESVEVIRE